MSYLEITEVILIYFNIIVNSWQQKLKVLYTFVSNKSINQLNQLNQCFERILIQSFQYIAVWFKDQNFKLLEIEDKINITLVIN